MELGLEGKTALVGASSRGLGRAVADELAKEGANLVICARTVGPLEEAGQWIHDATGVEVVAVPADLSNPEDIDRLIKTAEDDFGKIDILVTNTGGPPPGPFESHTVEAWSDAVEQNLNSVLNLTRAVLPAMKKAGWGRIINITSVAVKQPIDGLILSNAVRAAVTGFAKTLANEVAASGITVNNVMPGFTRTERLDGLAENIAETQGITVKEAFARWEGQSPMGRIGEPKEFAALVAFLASERASYITGTSIPVDGGFISALL
jgi:3-oxoacyl-[acyl-carrier protein] reductase